MLRRLSECVLALAFVVPIASSFVLNSPKALLRNPITTSLYTATPPTIDSTTTSTPVLTNEDEYVDEISDQKPLRVLIAGAGVGGLTLAHELSKSSHVQVQVLERTSKFKRFGGPIQLASNALQILSAMDPQVYAEINSKFTVTGDKENGIKDGIRSEWYAKFDLGSPARDRNMPYTGVIDRPDLQDIYLRNIPDGVIQNGDGVVSYTRDNAKNGVTITLDSGKTVHGDVLIGADGIWSSVRATMRGEVAKGEGSGAAYSGYTLFAGELKYDSFDHGRVGYKVYIGPNQYFVITDIGNGCYQWYAFLARPPGSASTEEKPEGTSPFLQKIFTGWSDEIHHILKATQEHEIEQRDLYDRPPSVMKPWTDGPVALLGDGVHAMMPNLGQGGCQAIEDAFVLSQELLSAKYRNEITSRLESYQRRRLIRSAAVQGLSRFASDIIIRGFDTPAKVVWTEGKTFPRFENFNYAGIVTKILQPILPIFFSVQFNFLYEGWRNEMAIDLGASIGFLFIGGFILLLTGGALGEAGLGITVGADALLGGEGIFDLDAFMSGFQNLL